MYKRFILDVDGVMTDGKIHWGVNGKLFKEFGPYDPDGLKYLKNYIDIQFISADESGWDITSSRIQSYLGFPLTLVKEKDRLNWVLTQGDPAETIFMGDGPYDAPIIKQVGLGIAPQQAYSTAKYNADYVTTVSGGSGAVMEACVYIMNHMRIKHGF